MKPSPLLRFASVALVVVLLALVVPDTTSAAPPPACPSQRDGRWTGSVFDQTLTRSTWQVDFTFTESSISAIGDVTSTNGFPQPSQPVALEGTVNCTTIEFHTLDHQATFSGTLTPDGRVANGQASTPVGAALWDLGLSAPSAPKVSVGSATVQEGNSGSRSVEIPVTLDSPSTSTVKVSYSTYGFTALPDDYVSKSGTLTFKPGSSGLTPVTKWIKIAIRPDVIPEDEDAFGIQLSNPVGATLGNTHGVVYILDDDDTPGPVLTISGTSIHEGDDGKHDLRLTIWLSQPVAVPVDVEYSTADHTAVSPSDYRPKSDELTFKPGQVRKAITIKAIPGGTSEGTETFLAFLLAATGAPIDRNEALFTIVED